MSKINKDLQSLMDKFPEHKFDLVKFVQAAKKSGDNLNYDTLRTLSSLYPKLSDELFPEVVVDFIASLLHDFHPKKIYDPWVKTGSLLSAIVEKFKPSEGALGTIREQGDVDYETVKYLTEEQNITWQLFNPDEIEKCDFLISAPQFGIKSGLWTLLDDNQWKKWYLDEEYQEEIAELHKKYSRLDSFIMVYSSLHFNSGLEVGIFVVSPHFFNAVEEEYDDEDPEFERTDKEMMKEYIDKTLSERDADGYYVDAAFQLPNGIFDPFSPIPLYLILMKRKKETEEKHSLFVGQISLDEKQNEILLQNYRRRRLGRIPQQGVLLDESEFRGLDILINEYEIRRMTAHIGFAVYPFRQVALKINFLGKQKLGNRFSESGHCVYVPIKGDSPIVKTEDEFTLTQEYVQIVLEPAIDNPEYFLQNREDYAWDWNAVVHSGLIPHPFNLIAIEVNFNGRKNFYDIFSEDNCVYMPIIGNAPVVTSKDELVFGKEYAQIVLDPEKVMAPYFVKLLNSNLGSKIRENLVCGLKVPKIKKSYLESSMIYLPDPETQRQAMQISSDISNLSAELSSLQSQLWNFPNEPSKIEITLRKFSQEKGWEIWLEDLPFPMASILWAYLSTVDPKDKLEHISHFFEASIQFFAMICLSAFAQDREYYRLNQKQWIDENPKYKGWYKNASFGNWLSLQSSLAKFTRNLLLKEDTRARCLSLFGNPSEQFIQTITSKRLLGIFQDANTYRNSWIGHRGRLSEEEAKKQISAFEDLLSKMREVIGDSFSQILLLSPKTSEYVDGIYDYTVKAIKGTRTEFRERVIQSMIPLDKKKLYMLPELQLRPIEILPFGKFMSSPKTEQNAFYFYSRFNNDGVRWVSYHFEKEADVTFPDPELVGMMKELFDGENGT